MTISIHIDRLRFDEPLSRRRTVLSFIPLFFQQLCGISVFFSYLTYFFSLASYPKPFEATVIQSCVSIVFMTISVFLVDRVGKRPLLLGGGLVMLACNLSVAGISFSPKLPGIPLVFLACLWTAAYGVSAGPLGA